MSSREERRSSMTCPPDPHPPHTESESGERESERESGETVKKMGCCHVGVVIG